jgi:hypothetical protein
MSKINKDAEGPTHFSPNIVNPLGEEVKRDGGGYKGLIDTDIGISQDKTLRGFIPPGNLKNKTQAEQYANPRSWPGLAGIEFGTVAKKPFYQKEDDAKLEKSRHMTRTGKP